MLKLFENVGLHAGESVKLPRKRDTRGREYGRTQYHLAALNVQIDSKSMPLGFKWPGKEPDPQVACDSQDCQITPDEDANIVMRMACGHAFHEACSIKNQVQTGFPVCCPLLKAEVNIGMFLEYWPCFQRAQRRRRGSHQPNGRSNSGQQPG